VTRERHSPAVAERERLRALVVAEATARGWSAAELARAADVVLHTAHAALEGGRVHVSTLGRMAAALGIGVPQWPPDRARDPSAIGRVCRREDVDIPALRWGLRALVDEARLSPEARALLLETGRAAGLPTGWESVALGEFEP